MRIGIDARFYGPRVGGGGLGRYVAELVTHLQEIDRSNEYVLFLRKENFHECVVKRANFTKRMVDVPWYTLAEQRVIPQEVALSRVNIMHFPHWNVPLFMHKPFVVTIHDLILLDDPQSAHSTTRGPLVHGLKYLGYRLALDNAVYRSRSIIAISDYTRRRVLERFRVKPAKVTRIYNGVAKPLAVDASRVETLGIRCPYVLHVGNAYPHKNLETLLAAFAMSRVAHPELTLVLAGRRDVFVERLEKSLGELGLGDDAVRFVNLPTDADLAALYAGAALFVYPSRVEGFGLPPLEAMTYGTPVAASASSCLPEVLGKAARYFRPDDAQTLSRYLNDALDAPERFAEAKQHAIHQPALYSWKKTAEATLNAYLLAAIRRV